MIRQFCVCITNFCVQAHSLMWNKRNICSIKIIHRNSNVNLKRCYAKRLTEMTEKGIDRKRNLTLFLTSIVAFIYNKLHTADKNFTWRESVSLHGRARIATNNICLKDFKNRVEQLLETVILRMLIGKKKYITKPRYHNDDK